MQFLFEIPVILKLLAIFALAIVLLGLTLRVAFARYRHERLQQLGWCPLASKRVWNKATSKNPSFSCHYCVHLNLEPFNEKIRSNAAVIISISGIAH